MTEITSARDLQPQAGDTNPNIRCEWWDPGTREAGFFCHAPACEWVTTLYAGEDESAESLRDRAAMDHDGLA